MRIGLAPRLGADLLQAEEPGGGSPGGRTLRVGVRGDDEQEPSRIGRLRESAVEIGRLRERHDLRQRRGRLAQNLLGRRQLAPSSLQIGAALATAPRAAGQRRATGAVRGDRLSADDASAHGGSLVSASLSVQESGRIRFPKPEPAGDYVRGPEGLLPQPVLAGRSTPFVDSLDELLDRAQENCVPVLRSPCHHLNWQERGHQMASKPRGTRASGISADDNEDTAHISLSRDRVEMDPHCAEAASEVLFRWAD